MTYTRNHAHRLLTATEYELFSESLADHVGDHDLAALRKLVGRTRRARDKYRDLYKRQRTSTRRKTRARGAAPDANERTSKKATMFDEALARLEKRLAKLEVAESRAKRRAVLQRTGKARPTASRAKPAARRTTRGSKHRRPTKDFTGPATAAQQRSSGPRGATAKSISAHRSAAGRRNQATRDRRSR